MEENAKTELALSEEQVQEITGGCAQCTADLNQANHHLAFARGYANISSAAKAKGKDITLYANLFDGHINAAQTLMDRVSARGHLDPPGTPPPSPLPGV